MPAAENQWLYTFRAAETAAAGELLEPVAEEIATFLRLTLHELSVEQQIAEVNRRWPRASQGQLEVAARETIRRLQAETAALRAQTALLNAPSLGAG